MLRTQLASAAFPQFFPSNWLRDSPDIVFTSFPSHIRIGYVLREGGRYSYLMRDQFNESGLSVEELHQASLQNLLNLPLPNLTVGKTPGGSEAWLSEAEDNFTAVRLLLPKVQSAFQAELGDSFRVSLPCRDCCICWSLDQAAEWHERNKREALRIFREDDYNLSPDIFTFSNGVFELDAAQTAA